MQHQSLAFEGSWTSDAGSHFARLSQMLRLVEQIAGRDPSSSEAALDHAARISGAYGSAPALVQRRFDTLAAETACWASAGVDALAAADNPRRQPKAAAARLADELETALRQLAKVLRV